MFLLRDSNSDRSFPQVLSAVSLETVCAGRVKAACRAVGQLHLHHFRASLPRALLLAIGAQKRRNVAALGFSLAAWVSPSPHSVALAEVAILLGWTYGTNTLSGSMAQQPQGCATLEGEPRSPHG